MLLVVLALLLVFFMVVVLFFGIIGVHLGSGTDVLGVIGVFGATVGVSVVFRSADVFLLVVLLT